MHAFPTFNLLVWCSQVFPDCAKIRLSSKSSWQVHYMALGKGEQGVSKLPCEYFPLRLMGLNHCFYCPVSPGTWFFPKVNKNPHARAALCWTSQNQYWNASEGYPFWRPESSEGLMKLINYKLHTSICCNYFQPAFKKK